MAAVLGLAARLASAPRAAQHAARRGLGARQCSTSTTLDAPSWGLPLANNVLGTVSDLFCPVGSAVREDDVVAVIETDKLSVDVKATHAGTVEALLVHVGDEILERQPLYSIRLAAAATSAAMSTEEAREWAEHLQKQRARIAVEEARAEAARESARETERAARHRRAKRNLKPGWGAPDDGATWGHAWHAPWRFEATARVSRSSPDARRRHPVVRVHQEVSPALPLAQLVAAVMRNRNEPYRCLGLRMGASRQAVRERYLKLAMKLHPDRAKHPHAREAFTAMDGAFRTLLSKRTGHFDSNSSAGGGVRGGDGAVK